MRLNASTSGAERGVFASTFNIPVARTAQSASLNVMNPCHHSPLFVASGYKQKGSFRMSVLPPNKPNSDILAVLANIAGVASLVLAVANGNLEKLSTMQRWGLASASALMFWVFFIGAVVKFAKTWHGGDVFFAAVILFFGGTIGGCLLLTILPMFSFGLPADQHEILAAWAAAIFAGLCVIVSISMVSDDAKKAKEKKSVEALPKE